jgi:bacillithiol system protein YtxJ
MVDMHPRIARIDRLEQLDQLLSDSATRPVLLFKHSYTCGISAEALDELLLHLSAHASGPGAAYGVVTVQTHRDISNAVARRLGVRHETPQALLVRGGKVVWSASHFRVTARAVGEAITRYAEQ